MKEINERLIRIKKDPEIKIVEDVQTYKPHNDENQTSSIGWQNPSAIMMKRSVAVGCMVTVALTKPYQRNSREIDEAKRSKDLVLN